jgi:hypothetical protein
LPVGTSPCSVDFSGDSEGTAGVCREQPCRFATGRTGHRCGIRALAASLALAALIVPAVAAGATARETTACLTGHRVLTTAGAPREGAYLMPRRVPGLGTLPGTALVRFSMALHPAFALANGTLLFERDPATALKVYRALLAVNLASARAVRGGGVDMTKARAEIKAMLRVSGNVVIAWRSFPVRPAARSLVMGCLR